MKRMLFLFLALLLLLGGCTAEAPVAEESGQEDAISLSERADFKCYAEYDGQSLHLDGEQAQSLFALISENEEAHSYEPAQLPSESVRLVFYASEQKFPFNEDYENCLDYTVYGDGLISQGHPPKLSAPFYFQGKAELYDHIFAMLNLSE